MKYHTTQSGFTLVETLVSITILLIIIIGPMTISSTTAKSTSFASEQVTAFFLAQEGVELVQKARDDLFVQYYLLSGATADPWGAFTNSTSGAYRDCYESDGCGLETSNLTTGILVTPVDCNGTSPACLLYFDVVNTNARSRYTHISAGAGKVQSIFTRKVYLTHNPARPYEVKVVSEVTWRTGNLKAEQNARVESYLLNTYANN